MKVFLAGGVSANLKPIWSSIVNMKLFLAGGESRHWIYDNIGDIMQIFLAGENGKKKIIEELNKDNMKMYLAGTMYGNQSNAIQNLDIDLTKHRPYILESFYYADEVTEKLIPYFGEFLLDSGAFTFMSNIKKGNINWKDYIDRYIDFINRNNVKHFFELDIDCIVGYDNVLKIRKYIEEKTGKKCIPVWHKSRGKEEFLKMCEEYDYVAIGGIVSKEITSKEYPFFTWFINEAHKRGCKIHGLGFTSLENITKYKFDSVDSTAWTTGNRFGFVYKFNGKTMKKIDAPQGCRLKDSKKVALNNYIEWIKFQKFADKNL